MNCALRGPISLLFQGNRIFNQIPIASQYVIQYRGSKHWHPKFRHLRAKKFIKVDLIDFDKLRADQNMTTEEMRSKMKEEGIVPPRPWIEKPIFISCTPDIFEPFVPPEGDGKVSILSKEGAKQRMEFLTKKGKSYLTVRKIRQFEDDFDVPTLAENCQKIYIESHEALVKNDEDALHTLVTEKCFPEIMENSECKTIRWSFIKSIEPPRIVHMRHTDIITKENIFVQATVRMHTQQTLAVYDRFGRLMHGSEAMIKDVLEYVVFEKHIANQYGSWRIHAKIIPDWMPPREPMRKTYVRRDLPIMEDENLPVEQKEMKPAAA